MNFFGRWLLQIELDRELQYCKSFKIKLSANVSALLIPLCFSVFAEKLKTGQKISPEAFEIVTVLLMQMTHYEHIVLDSTPAQLIDILNEYNHFVDETVKHFDCQKLDIDADLITVIFLSMNYRFYKLIILLR